MSFIEMNGLNDVTEQKPVPEGEYTLVITDVKEKNDDSGNLKGLLIIHEIQGAPDNTSNVMHNLSFPLPADDADKRKNKLLFAKRYLTLFGVKFDNGIDVATLPGKKAKCKLKLEEYEGAFSNKIVTPVIK